MYLRSVLECNHFQDFWCIHPNSRNQFETGHTKHLTLTRRMRPITQKGKWNDDLDITMGPKKCFMVELHSWNLHYLNMSNFVLVVQVLRKRTLKIRTLPLLSNGYWILNENLFWQKMWKEGRSSKDNLQVMTSLQGMSDEFRSIVIDLWSLNCKHRQLTFFLPDSEDTENA